MKREVWRESRKHYEQNIPQVYEILRKGSETARAEAARTLADVRKAMKIDYFEDADLIAEHTKKYQNLSDKIKSTNSLHLLNISCTGSTPNSLQFRL